MHPNVQTSSRQTVGGVVGHIIRRVIHVSILAIPIVYYLWGKPLAASLHMLPYQLVLILLGLIVLLELIRIKKGFTAFSQRAHEATHISSFGWTAIALALLLIFLPNSIYAIPVVAACAIGDPLMGELRAHANRTIAALAGVVVIALLWWFCSMWMAIAWWWPLVIAPLTVVAEWPNLRWIDDNAMMLLVGLVFVLLVA